MDNPSDMKTHCPGELKKYNIDIAALSETRLAGEDSLIEVGQGYTFFWKGLPEDTRRLHGVGFAIKSRLLLNIPESPVGISKRLMTWRIPLAKVRYATLLSAYAPTLDAEESIKDVFYESLDAALLKVPHTDKLVLMGDFNARVGSNNMLWSGVIGKHGLGNINRNGLRLLSLCSEHKLVITNSISQMKNKYKASWMHPRSKHWHLLDYIITRQQDLHEISITRAMRGVECWTDHRLIRSKIHLKVRPQHTRHQPSRRLNFRSLKSPDVIATYRRCLANNLSSVFIHPLHNTAESVWANFSSAIQQAATDTIGFTSKRHHDWFDDSCPEILVLLEEKRKAFTAHLFNPQSPSLHSHWSNIPAEVQRLLRIMENDWWLRKAHEIQGYADTNNSQAFYDAIKSLYGPQKRRITPIRSADGKVLKRVMLSCLTKSITERILPESQCGFRKDRSTSDMIFVLRQMQEKAREQKKDLFIAFIDLAKAFDTIDRQVLWVILEKFGVPPRFLYILQQFHFGMQACVTVGTSQSPSFPVQVGVKQGCVLAPVIFNLFLAAVTLLSRNSLSPDEGVCLQFRLDRNLFDLRRLQAITKCTTLTIHELQYADDCALQVHSPTTMQHTLDVVCAV
ncbi:uncharacterized protein LOC143742394 [Siphateles boraxobius]|uniref:uncharacterized protein LOC143742394 n=1 Tax=Siphateles boraxobius TaxID=180520 RepID=UPI0040631360